MRPMFLEFPTDENIYNKKFEDTQFFVGPSLLVAPVVTEGQVSRTVYLPGNQKWFDLETSKEYEGGKFHEISVPLDHMPIFVKENSIIPMRKNASSNVYDGLKVDLDFKRYFPSKIFDLVISCKDLVVKIPRAGCT